MSAPMTRTQELVGHGCITAARACHTKVAHWSKNDADAAIKRAARKGITLERYGCPFAHKDYPHWHLTRARQEGGR